MIPTTLRRCASLVFTLKGCSVGGIIRFDSRFLNGSVKIRFAHSSGPLPYRRRGSRVQKARSIHGVPFRRGRSGSPKAQGVDFLAASNSKYGGGRGGLMTKGRSDGQFRV